MSDGFSGTSTRKIGKSQRELDAFTDDFKRPWTADTVPGEDHSKPDNNYQDKHTDLKQKPALLKNEPDSFNKEFEKRMAKESDNEAGVYNGAQYRIKKEGAGFIWHAVQANGRENTLADARRKAHDAIDAFNEREEKKKR